MNDNSEIGKQFTNFYKIIEQLRGPDGCPWDKKQTIESMRQYLIEETYEAVSAVNENDMHNLKEELGDLLLIIVMISIIGKETNRLNINEIITGISEKIIRRHPHVFSDKNAETADEVVKMWDDIKVGEKLNNSSTEINTAESKVYISKSFPEMERAYRIQKAAKKHDFDWDNYEEVFEKIDEEIIELKTAIEDKQAEEVENELGDLLFTIINLSRKLKVHPSLALHKTNEKFIKRFSYIEKKMEEENLKMHKDHLEKMEEHWQESKNIFDNKIE